ncbi:Pkinase-domain-containing protein [Xylariaceae sp. FL0016]|nr:Pkinase-domain-containing protein [Xylariaceae sp. FL0016]
MAKMSHPDMAPIMRDGPAGFSSPTSNHHRHQRRPPANSRDVAMARDRSRDGRDGSRDRTRPDHDRPFPAATSHARLRSQSPVSRHGPGYRDRERRPGDARRYDREDGVRPGSSHRVRSRDRDRGHHHDTRPSRAEPFELDRRRDIPSSPRHSRRAHDLPPQYPRDRSFSPSSRKRRRSRSPIPFPPPRPKKKRDRERDRRRKAERTERMDRSVPSGPAPSRFDQQQSPSRRRSRSPGYDDNRYRYSDRSDALDRHRHRSRSPPHEAEYDRDLLPTRSRTEHKIRDRSRSPRTNSRRSSFSRTHSPPRSFGRPPPGAPEGGSFARRSPTPLFDAARSDALRSPRDRGSRHSRKKGKPREERFPVGGPPAATGANSIEVNMDRRGDSRSFEPQLARHPSRTHHHPDSRRGQSPHANSGSSLHGSPGVESPRSSSRVGRDYPQPFSPSDRPSLPSNSRGIREARTGSSNRRDSSRSPPRFPTGPARARGFSRGSFRGGFSSVRGGVDDNDAARHGQEGASTSHDKDQPSPSAEDAGPHYMEVDHTHNGNSQQDDWEESDRPRKPRDQENDESAERSAKEDMAPSRPPPSAPTGPASSKFSFAFKATNKAPVATPKPEISQKFSAAPKKDVQSIDDRDRDLPKDTPRGPASSRAREEYHRSRPAPETRPPRTHKVKKVFRKLRPKPQLEPHLAKSTSVFFRKPGNASVIGSGTYGKVFKGKHVYTGKLVALKRIRMEGEKDGFPVTAVREVKLLQSLKHTNIVQLQEVMVEKNDCYMVFEYLSHDLTGLLNHPSYKLDPAQKKHLAKQLFEGLDYLHKRGVLHRDIKAANILVSSDGILKLADFGLARFYAKRHEVDYTNRVVTVWYRSPELLLGETRYGAAVDIWSAACVMVEIFTRHAIFPGDGGEISQLEKIHQILGTPNRTDWPGLIDMPWFELLRPGYRKPNVFEEKYKERVPAAAFELLADMFQYDPLKRPSAADALEHPYFTTEHPPPRQAVELAKIQGDWHEFESKALRREKEKQEKQEREARRAAAAKEGNRQREKDNKRPPSSHEGQREAKRAHVEGQAPSLGGGSSSTTMPDANKMA